MLRLDVYEYSEAAEGWLESRGRVDVTGVNDVNASDAFTAGFVN